MLWLFLIAVTLGPIVGCAMLVMLAPQPNVLTAALGAILGMLASLTVVLVFG